MKENKNQSIQVRLTESEKEKIIQKAKDAGLSKSDYIRALALKDDSLKILANGQSAATAMVSLQVEIQQATRSNKISDDQAKEILTKLENISKMLYEILSQIDDISFSEEEE